MRAGISLAAAHIPNMCLLERAQELIAEGMNQLH